MNLEFKDHFSVNSEKYKKYRPEYPPALFTYLASISPTREIAWDCATGTGQTAKGLIQFFKKVVATDPSKSQIRNAEKRKGIHYAVGAAEQSHLQDGEADIITVSQALHWFRIHDFFQEADRVLKTNGILAVWSYNLLAITPVVDRLIAHFYHETLGDYWPQERRMVENEYDEIDFPFQKIRPPSFAMQAEWNLDELIGYLSTWSAVKEFQSTHAESPVINLYEKICPYWGNPNEKMTINWPLSLKIRKKIS
jgi:ubiquinone/menaquinone biosynthesis C-methylase UbiE